MDDRTQSDILFFFDARPDALPLYEAVQAAALECDAFGPVRVKVGKTQIGFYNRRLFACASFARVKRAEDLPHPWLTVTFGLDRKVESGRIAIATEPYPRRWTHHIVIGAPEEVDGELKAWLRRAAEFAANKS